MLFMSSPALACMGGGEELSVEFYSSRENVEIVFKDQDGVEKLRIIDDDGMASAHVAVRYLSLNGKTSEPNYTNDIEVLNFIARNLKLFKTKLGLFKNHYNISTDQINLVNSELDYIVNMKPPADVNVIEKKLAAIVKITPPGYEVIEKNGSPIRKSLDGIKLPSKTKDRGVGCNSKFGGFNPQVMNPSRTKVGPSLGIPN
jgi:hypothetical protein